MYIYRDGAGYSVLTGIMLLIFAPQVIGAFYDEPEGCGVWCIYYEVFLSVLLDAWNSALLGGTIRGTGKTMQAMVVFLVSFVDSV